MYMRYQFSNPSQHSKARKNIPAKKHPWLSYIFVHRMYAIGRPVNLHRPRFRSDLNFLFRPKTCRYVGHETSPCYDRLVYPVRPLLAPCPGAYCIFPAHLAGAAAFPHRRIYPGLAVPGYWHHSDGSVQTFPMIISIPERQLDFVTHPSLYTARPDLVDTGLTIPGSNDDLSRRCNPPEQCLHNGGLVVVA